MLNLCHSCSVMMRTKFLMYYSTIDNCFQFCMIYFLRIRTGVTCGYMRIPRAAAPWVHCPRTTWCRGVASPRALLSLASAPLWRGVHRQSSSRPATAPRQECRSRSIWIWDVRDSCVAPREPSSAIDPNIRSALWRAISNRSKIHILFWRAYA